MICDRTNGIPFYIQSLGREILRTGVKVDRNNVEGIIEEFLREEGNLLFNEEFKVLSPREKRIMISIAKGCKKPSEISREIEDTANVTSRYLIYLMEKGMVDRIGTEYKITDPMFERWLNGKYGEVE